MPILLALAQIFEKELKLYKLYKVYPKKVFLIRELNFVKLHQQ